MRAKDAAGESKPVRGSRRRKPRRLPGTWEYRCRGCDLAFASMAAWERHVDATDCRRMELHEPDPKETP